MPSPLFIKYQTKTGNRYLYDCATGRILGVDETIYAIVNDFRKLADEDVVKKYEKLGADQVRTALGELYDLQKRGCMVDHVPTEASPVEIVQHKGVQYSIGEFWQKTGMLLILGITERCNLDCSYCCYSGKFEGQRTHSPRTMSFDIARRAITEFLTNDHAGNGTCPITFYGGEPLLEFHLLQECVRFAEELAQKLGKAVRFAITTNATLLDDQACDFLMEHGFSTLISIDGPEIAHDRYRVFPNGGGSFDMVIKNVRRFIERYPGKVDRGLSVTLAAPTMRIR